MLHVELLTYTPDAEKVVAAAAKLCYAKSNIQTLMEGLTPEKTDSFLALLSSLGHESPVEHASFTFGVDGVSRALLAQLTRHRIASFSVQSQRYVDKSHFSYVVPPEIEAIPEAKAEFIKAMEEDAAHYEALKQTLLKAHAARLAEQGMETKEAEKAAEKLANEDARFVLPNACERRLIMTMNVRSLVHFFNLRCCTRAQWEIRELAWQMLAEVKRVCPSLFRMAGPSCVGGACPEGRMSCGRMAEMRERAGALGRTDENS